MSLVSCKLQKYRYLFFIINDNFVHVAHCLFCSYLFIANEHSFFFYRTMNWSQVWRLIAEKDLTTYYVTTLADQDIFNAVIKEQPDLVFRLPCQWNLQFSDNSLSELCYSDPDQIKDLSLIHFNSPKKLSVQHINAEYFRNQFLTFQQYDGGLLRRELYGCHQRSAPELKLEKDIRQSLLLDSLADDPVCYEMTKASTINYR